jgi:hypothetical protein
MIESKNAKIRSAEVLFIWAGIYTLVVYLSKCHKKLVGFFYFANHLVTKISGDKILK